ncbi:nuclear protein 96-domain-containing protein [Cercophora samala]|uniref:Nuclear protein 96-domain-containing protein n=1 Tax=Cercophora samala TaxID=330535 RepID=A0AA39ZKV5_9PEZI|nr:nuclear protein 96-domain-containing protein [Cercophora samala]
MAFSGFGGGGGFGQNNNTTGSTFGGFGAAANNTTSGFGAGTGFGANNNAAPGTTGNSLFGGGTTGGFGANTTGGAFGGGGFGAAKPSAFGTPASTSGGGLFGSTTATAGGGGFGGFGNTANTAATTTPFGGGGGSSMFGAAKPATTGFGGTGTGFGAGATGGGLFGGGGAATTGTGFGATTNPGIGVATGDAPGTAVVAFSPLVEKEPNNPTQSNSFQNVMFMDAYKRWSTEELRLVDYNQGRKSGGATGSTFGSTNFGGFGATGGTTTGTGFGGGATTGSGLFGGAGTSGGFGAATTTPAATTGGFGGSSLFGAKPATTTTGMFGSTPAQPATTGGGLFGGGGGGFGTAGTTTGGGFGGAGTTGGGLFGGNTATAAKPASGFSFGAAATTTPSTGFGGTAAGGTGGLFGAAPQQPAATTGGLFGTQQQQQPATTGFGGFGQTAAQPAATGGIFGAQAAKPATGLFGAATTTAQPATNSLFGGSGTTAGTGFGGAAAQPATGGLFGAKPATTGLFGTAPAANTGGLFGGTQQQPATSGFGASLTQNNQQKSLFGNTTTGGGLFSQQAQPQAGSLFGPAQSQPQLGLGNSLLGASQQQQQQQQQGLSTSITDLSAYGAATLFSGLSDDKVINPGPLATPLSGRPKVKSRSILPMYKLSPANASRFVTPQKRGYGFSYSAYGSPATPSSISSTPGGFGQSLLASSVNRGLSKSISASNLRRSFNVEDSILQPGAFSANSSMRLLGSGSSNKKLIINKDMRSDLFSSSDKKQAQEDASGARKLAKRVSFDTSTADDHNGEVVAITDGTESDNLGYLRPSIRSTNGANGNKASPVTTAPEMTQVKGNELAIVHEEESPVAARAAVPAKAPASPAAGPEEPGEYWMSPSLEELRAMNRMQRQKVVDFTVGRVHVGNVQFKVPVDLSNINVDEIIDNIVILVPRSATVYPVAAKKPPVGKGLNVPALISLEHSWPRGGRDVSGRRLEKHIQKLKVIPDTTFEDYDPETGVWQFSVEHFTTYGLDDDDSDDEEFEEEAIVHQPVQAAKRAQQVEQIPSPVIEASSTSPVDPDDTFEFKRSRRTLPGAFDDDEAAMFDEEEDSDVSHHQGTPPHEPLDADTPIPSREWPEDESMADGPDDYQLEAYDDSYEQGSVDGAQDEFQLSRYDDNTERLPAGIVRAQMRALKKSTAPTKIEVAGGDDWTQILQASVRAPRTVDRATLRELNETGAVWDMKDRGSPAPKDVEVNNNDDGFATSLDLMKSLFQQTKGGPTQSSQASPAKGFVKWPYQTRSKVEDDETQSVPRPNWGPDGVLVTAHDGEASLQAVDGSITPGGEAQVNPKILAQLQQYIDSVSGFQGDSGPEFKKLAHGDSVWELASLLFDDNGHGLPRFWKQLVMESTKTALARAESAEEKAIICLAGNLVPEACAQLVKGRDMRLAVLVAGIGSQQQDIKAQLRDWRESNVLSEISEPVRAIYELLAGNACVCDGVKDAPIESRVSSFTISQRFGLDWMQAFGLRLFYSAGAKEGGPNVKEAIKSFQTDVEQDREPEPGSQLWSLLKAFANQEFDWSDGRLGWLMTRAIHASGKVGFGEDDVERLDAGSVSFAAALTGRGDWVPAAFVLLQLSDRQAREKAVRDHLGRLASLVGAPRNPDSAFNALKKFGVPEGWIWEAKALDYRAKGETHQEFLALVWARNYGEANRAFVTRVGPDLVIGREFKKLATYAQLLFKVKRNISDWDRAAVVYLLYPMVRLQQQQQSGGKGKGKKLDEMDEKLFDGLVALRGMAKGDLRQEAAIADMAEELIRVKGGEARLYGLLPRDVAGKYRRAEVLGEI